MKLKAISLNINSAAIAPLNINSAAAAAPQQPLELQAAPQEPLELQPVETLQMSLKNSLPDNPFVGLRPYKSEESVLFFGRHKQIVELLQQLHRTRFLAVVGSSGCGKSSLIRAGLIPKLKAGFLVE